MSEPLSPEQYTETFAAILANEPRDDDDEVADGVVTRLVCIAEVSTGGDDDRWLCLRATDAGGMQLKSWEVLGMLATAKGMVE